MGSKLDIVKKEDLQEIRVIMIGKTGAGKSYVGNNVLGREQFESSVIATSVTSSCDFGKQEITSCSRKYMLKVIDTPGLKDNRLPEKETCSELVKCISLSLPGPHFFVIVVPIGRFTGEELDVVELLKREFGEELMNFALVVFTHGSKLKNMSIEDYLKAAPPALQQVVKECQNRYAVIYDDGKNLQASVQSLIDLIVNSTRPVDYYTNDMFKKANENKQKIVAELEENKNREVNDLEKKVEDLKKELETCSEEGKKKLKEEKQRQEEQLKKIKTTSSEEIYDRKVISDNSITKSTWLGATAGAIGGVIVTGCSFIGAPIAVGVGILAGLALNRS